MLQIRNATPFKASLMLLPDADGIDTMYTVVKGTFALGERLTLADEQLPVVLADQHYEDPASSSIKVPSDVCLGKRQTDVLVVGSACAPADQPVWSMDVSVSVGGARKTVQVFGDRVWDGGSGVATIAYLTPFVRMPLTWERAYGGADETSQGPARHPRNPVGTGFRARGGTKPAAGTPLPNVEDPASLISGPSDGPAPVGFAPIAPTWEPRRLYAGTYDDVWQAERAPYLPKDFDSRFFQLAPAGLGNGQLQGGELVELRGLTPNGFLQFPLPLLGIRAVYRLEGTTEERAGVLDTVIIEPDAGRLIMIWRAALRCDKKSLKVREVHTSLVEAT
jgi:hypothetical protein